MKDTLVPVKYLPEYQLYEVVVGGEIIVVSDDYIKKFPGSKLVKYVLDTVANQQK